MPHTVADALSRPLKPRAEEAPPEGNPADELVAVLLDEGRVRLSDSLSMSYHALKLPGIDQLYHELEPHKSEIGEGNGALASALQKIEGHITTLLEACDRVKDFVKPQSRRKSGVVPPSIVDRKRPEVSASAASFGTSAWPFMKTLLTTQSFAQWVGARSASMKKKKKVIRTVAAGRRTVSRTSRERDPLL